MTFEINNKRQIFFNQTETFFIKQEPKIRENWDYVWL